MENSRNTLYPVHLSFSCFICLTGNLLVTFSLMPESRSFSIDTEFGSLAYAFHHGPESKGATNVEVEDLLDMDVFDLVKS